MSQDRNEDYWARAVLEMAEKGAITERSLAIVIRPGADWSGNGYAYARALLAAYKAGRFEKPRRFPILRSFVARILHRPLRRAVVSRT